MCRRCLLNVGVLFSSSSKMLLLVFTSFNWWLLIAANISGIILHLSSKPVRMSRKKNHCRKILAFASENDEIKKKLYALIEPT